MRRLLVFGVLALAGCGVQLAEVTPALVEAARPRYSDVTAAELTRGRELLQTKCTACHGVRDPKDHTAEQWAWYVTEMGKRAQLPVADRQAVLRYVVTAGQ